MLSITARFLQEVVKTDLTEKMVFVGGPRQVGKTTFALSFLDNADETHPAYYFRERTDIPCFYQTHLGEKDFGNAEATVRVLPFHKFCTELGLP